MTRTKGLIFLLLMVSFLLFSGNREAGLRSPNILSCIAGEGLVLETPLMGPTIDLPAIPPKEFNVVDFGAVGDGLTNDTKSIQKAIDVCAENKGGVILFPPGVYLSGTIFLRSNTNLHLKEGAILLGSEDLELFPENKPKIRSYTDNYTTRSLIYAENESNITISGKGIIDGQGAKYPVTRDVEVYKLRPYLIRIIGCTKILVEDVTFLNSPMWVQHYLACDHLTIQNITVASRRANYNNDGIDIDGCHFVRITGCNISSEDDGIVLKSTLNRLCENIMVDNCTITSLASAFKLGTESNGGFRNITFVNSTIHHTDNSGIALEIVDGGTIDGVFISDITMSDVGNAIFIRLGNRARPFIQDGETPKVGSVRNITIKNIHATNIGKYNEAHTFREFPNSNEPHIPASILGLPNHPVEDVHLENIYLQYTGGFDQKPESLLPIPENENHYPEFDRFGQLPASGFYMRHVKNISFKDLKTETKQPDTRKEIFLDSDAVNVSRDGVPIKL